MQRAVFTAAVVLLLAGCVRAQVVAGQGSSAQRALGVKFATLGCAGVAGVKYTATSSVLGIAAVKAGGNTGVDFALSDIPDLPCSPASPLLNVPYGLGLMAVHARPGTIAGLKLTACALDRIYKCTAKTWSDPVLGALNPRLKTYAKPIVKIARKEVSGTTYTFTNFLGKVCPGSWKFGSITLLSNAAALKPCFATMVKAQGTAGVQAAFGTGAAGPANVIAYVSANALVYGEVSLQAKVGGGFFTPATVNPAALVAGLVYGAPTCNPALDVTGKGATYPLAYVTFFMVNKKRKGKPNIAGVKSLCTCIANTKNTLLFTGLKDFKAAPAAMKTAAVARCNGILLT